METNFQTQIVMKPYLLLWFVSIFVTVWNCVVCIYYLLPINERGDKYIPGIFDNLVLLFYE